MITNKYSTIVMAAVLFVSVGAAGIASATESRTNGRSTGMQVQMSQGGMHTMFMAERDTFNDHQYRGGMQGRKHMNMDQRHYSQQKKHWNGNGDNRGRWNGDQRKGYHNSNRGHQNNYMGNQRGHWGR